MTSSRDILVVDDDPRLREVVRYALAREGFIVRECEDGRAALAALEQQPADLLVLDVLMPEMGGLEVCQELRRRGSRIPIVFLSSRGEEIDRVLGLELGGDDYLAKPFSTRELVSRVRAVLRRSGAEEPEEGGGVEVAGLRLDPVQHRVWGTGVLLDLTVTEFRLLETLMRQPGRAWTRDELRERAYEGPHFVADRTLDSHVRRIRAKLRDVGLDPIQTVYGVGYRLQS